MNKRKIIIYLLLIISISGAFRFYGLKQRGLFYPDETRYYRDALTARGSIDNYRAGRPEESFKGFVASLLPLSEAFAGKPGHTFLGVIGLYVFGGHQYSVLFVSALFGVATVFLVFLIGYRFYDIKVGLLSALILAVCSAHVLYSRSFLAHSNQAFFLVLGVYLYLSGLYLWSGISLGYAFITHPTGLIYFTPFLLCELFMRVKKRRSLIRIFSFSLCFFIPFFIIEFISVFGREEFGSLLVAIEKSYIVQLLFVNKEAFNLGIEHNRNLGPFHYAAMSRLSNGIVFTILLVVSAVFNLGHYFRKRRVHSFFIGIVPISLFVYWQFITPHERLFREILFLFPFFCIMMAVFIARLNKKAAVLIVSLLVLEGIWHSKDVLLQVRSDYSKIENFLVDNNVKGIVTPSEYLAATSDVLMPNLKDTKFYIVSSMDEAGRLMREEGITWFIMQPGDWIGKKEFRLKSTPLITAREPHYTYYPSFYESMKIGKKLRYLNEEDKHPETRQIVIYDLKKEAL